MPIRVTLNQDIQNGRQVAFYPIIFFYKTRKEGRTLHYQINFKCELCEAIGNVCSHIDRTLLTFPLEASSPEEKIQEFFQKWLLPRRRSKKARPVLEFNLPSATFSGTDVYKVRVFVVPSSDPKECMLSLACNCKSFEEGGLKPLRDRGISVCKHTLAVMRILREHKPFKTLVEKCLKGEVNLKDKRPIRIDRFTFAGLLFTALGGEPHFLLPAKFNEKEKLSTILQDVFDKGDKKKIQKTLSQIEKEMLLFISSRTQRFIDEYQSFFKKDSSLNLVKDELLNCAMAFDAYNQDNLNSLLETSFFNSCKVETTEHQKALINKINHTKKLLTGYYTSSGSPREFKKSNPVMPISEIQAYNIIRMYADKEGLDYTDLVAKDKFLPPIKVRYEIEVGMPLSIIANFGSLRYYTSTWNPEEAPFWVVGSDASIKMSGGYDGIEIKTGFAEGLNSNLDLLLKTFAWLENKKARANKTCGVHVHIDFRSLSPHVAKLFTFYWITLEEILFKHIVSPARIDNTYCKLLSKTPSGKFLIKAIRENEDSLFRDLKNKDPQLSIRLLGHYFVPAWLNEENRYYTLNTQPYLRWIHRYSGKNYGTFEARFFHVPAFKGQVQQRSAYFLFVPVALMIQGTYSLATQTALNEQILYYYKENYSKIDKEIKQLIKEAKNGNLSINLNNLSATQGLFDIMGLTNDKLPSILRKKLGYTRFSDRQSQLDSFLKGSLLEAIATRIKKVAHAKAGFPAPVQSQEENREQSQEQSQGQEMSFDIAK